MSLIKAVDVPKHMADRLRSRRIAVRLSGGASKKPTLPAGKPLAVSPIAPDKEPARHLCRPASQMRLFGEEKPRPDGCNPYPSKD